MPSLLTIGICCSFLFCQGESFLELPSLETRTRTHKLQRPSLISPKSLLYHGSSIRYETKLLATSAVVNGAAVSAILKLLCTCGLGAYATVIGVIDKNALSTLSKLVFNVFQPCLLFVNVALTLSKNSRDSAIFLLPIAAAIQIFLGYFLGKFVAWAIYGSETSDDKKQLIACTTFSNSGPLPLVFTDSIFRNHMDPALAQKSIAYISMYLLSWSPLFWSVGSSILGADDSSMSREEKRKQVLSRILSPPILACLAGLVVGMNSFLTRLFVSPKGLMYPLFGAMQTLSAAYLPAVLLVLAGSLVPQGPQDPDDISVQTKSTTTQFVKRVLAVYTARFLLMPMLAFGGLKLIRSNFPALAGMLSDKMLLFILLLESCMPSAQNSTVILQLQGNRVGAAAMARTLVAVYILGVPAMSYWLSRILAETALLA